MPLIALAVVWFTYGAVDLFNNALPNGPSVLVLSISPILLAWRAMDWPLVDGWIVWLGALGLAIPITMGLSRVTRAAGHSFGIRGPVIFGLAAAYIGSVFILADVRQDRRLPQKVEAEISSVGQAITISRRHHRDTRVRMKPWDLKPYGVIFSIRGYAAAPGDKYCSVLVHPGSLGIRWLELGSCYAASERDAEKFFTDIRRFKRRPLAPRYHQVEICSPAYGERINPAPIQRSEHLIECFSYGNIAQEIDRFLVRFIEIVANENPGFSRLPIILGHDLDTRDLATIEPDEKLRQSRFTQ